MAKKNKKRKKNSVNRSKAARERLKKMPSKNTKPEIKTKKILESLGIVFYPQYPMSGYKYDFYLPDYNTLLEVNGDFFHANPIKYHSSERNYTQIKNHTRDRRKLMAAKKKEKKIIYIWEMDLNERPGYVEKELCEYLSANFESRHLLEDLFPAYKKFYT